jgi:dimethylglycine dehydrogenase
MLSLVRGLLPRKTGEMVGLDIPVVPVEHQYIVTESHPEILKRRANGRTGTWSSSGV